MRAPALQSSISRSHKIFGQFKIMPNLTNVHARLRRHLFTMRHFTLLLLVSLTNFLNAQEKLPEEVIDNSNHVEQKDRSTQEFMNNQGAEASLVNGGAFFVNNPPPAYKVDVDKAYLNKDFKKMKVTFHNGEDVEVYGRIRRVDSKVEIMQEGDVFELRDNYTRQIELEDGTTYLMLYDPLKKRKGAAVYERAYQDEEYTLLVLHTSEWQDPKPRTMFDTSEPHRTLKVKEEVVLLRGDDSARPVSNSKSLLMALAPSHYSDAAYQRKRLKVKNNVADYVRLLEGIAGN